MSALSEAIRALSPQREAYFRMSAKAVNNRVVTPTGNPIFSKKPKESK